jgi:hypothetical protein
VHAAVNRLSGMTIGPERSAVRRETPEVRIPLVRISAPACPLPAGWASGFTDRTALPYLPVELSLIAEIHTDSATDGPFDRPRPVRRRPTHYGADRPRASITAPAYACRRAAG